MTWANEPVVFTSLTIHLDVVNIVKMKGNSEQRRKEALPTHRDVKFIVLLLNKTKAKCFICLILSNL